MFESKEEKKIKFEKQLYETSIIQNLLDTVDLLEQRIKKLEDR